MFDIDFGAMFAGESKNGKFNVLSNNSGATVNIKSIDFKGTTDMNLVISPYNKTILDKSDYYLTLRVSPASAGVFEANLLIQTDAGDFNIKVKCSAR